MGPAVGAGSAAQATPKSPTPWAPPDGRSASPLAFNSNTVQAPLPPGKYDLDYLDRNAEEAPRPKARKRLSAELIGAGGAILGAASSTIGEFATHLPSIFGGIGGGIGTASGALGVWGALKAYRAFRRSRRKKDQK